MAASDTILATNASTDMVDVPRSLMWIRRHCPKSLLSLIIEMMRLGRGSNKLTAHEYISFQLYDDRKYSSSDKRRFLGRRAVNEIYNRIISPFYCGMAQDKLLTNALLQSYGLPVPKTYAVYHKRRSDSSAPVFRTPAELAGFLRDGMTYPCFAKPINGWESRGATDIRGYDAASDSLVLYGGKTVKVDAFAAEMAGLEIGGLFQELLQPHPELRRLAGDRVSTVRPITFVSDQRLEVYRAVWKIAVGDNIADNYWRPGNMLAALDPATGRIERVVRGAGVDHEEVEIHPDTDERLIGAILPQWNEVLRIARELALILPELRIIAPDIAITERGPVFVEVNPGGDMKLPQIATGRGVMDEEFQGFIDEVGRFKPLYSL